MIEYRPTVDGLVPDDLHGFFVGWPVKPSHRRHLAALRGSYRVIVAVDAATVVGFVNTISDGVATAFIPWLEVLPDYQRRGIGRELMMRMLAELADMYSVDLTCDPELSAYYRSLGFAELQGMGVRRRGAFTG